MVCNYTDKTKVMCECTSGLFNAPISGMPHLAYLACMGQMLEERGVYAVGIFPRGQNLVWIVLIHSSGVYLCTLINCVCTASMTPVTFSSIADRVCTNTSR